MTRVFDEGMTEAATTLMAKLSGLLPKVIVDATGVRHVERLSGGASQETYRIEVETPGGVRRLAMRRAAGGELATPDPRYPGLRVEAQIMCAARAAGVPEPNIYYVFEPADGLGDGFIMEWLEGETLGAKIVKSPDFEGVRPKLAFKFGATLARIHGIDIRSVGLDTVLPVLEPGDYVHQTWERYRVLGSPQPMIDFTARWLLDNLPAPVPPALVHNDFRNGNVMVDTSGVVAVLDWELAHLGDPRRDLGWMLTPSWRFGRPELPVGGFGKAEDFFAGYESVAGATVDRQAVRFWQVFGAFWWAVGCLEMAEHYRSGPDKTVERPAIGRRSSECQVDCVNLLIPGVAELLSPHSAETAYDLPSADELLASVIDFLRGEVMPQTTGRTRFLSRVAGNSLEIVKRELIFGQQASAAERDRLQRLLQQDGQDLTALRWMLVYGLRDGSMALDAPGLAEHLRATVVNRLQIDQPTYPGLATALAGGVDGW